MCETNRRDIGGRQCNICCARSSRLDAPGARWALRRSGSANSWAGSGIEVQRTGGTPRAQGVPVRVAITRRGRGTHPPGDQPHWAREGKRRSNWPQTRRGHERDRGRPGFPPAPPEYGAALFRARAEPYGGVIVADAGPHDPVPSPKAFARDECSTPHRLIKGVAVALPGTVSRKTRHVARGTHPISA